MYPPFSPDPAGLPGAVRLNWKRPVVWLVALAGGLPGPARGYDAARISLLDIYHYQPVAGTAALDGYMDFPPILGNDGNAVYVGVLRNNGFFHGYCLLSGNGSGAPMRRIASGPDAVPAKDGNYGSFGDIQTADGGRVLFHCYLNSVLESGTSHRVHHFNPAATPLVGEAVREGNDPVLGNGTAANSVVLNNSGEVSVHRASERIAIKDLGTNAATGIVLARSTMVEGVEVLGASSPSLNDAGEVAFRATMNSGGTALVRSDGVTYKVLVRSTFAAPGGNGTLSNLRDQVRLDENGRVAFFSGLSGTTGGTADDHGLFMADDDGIYKIARSGEFVPDGDGRYLTDDGGQASAYFAMNRHGTLFFASTISGASAGRGAGLFLGTTAGVTQVARTGDEAPGGGVFASFDVPSLSINRNGEVAFLAGIDRPDSGPPGSPDSFGIFFRTTTGKLMPVVLTGAKGPGSTTVHDVYYKGGALDRATEGATGLNDKSQVAFKISDGSDFHLGIWSLNPPKPEIQVMQPATRSLVDGKAEVKFPSTKVGSKSSALTFTIKNTGKGTLRNLAVTVGGKQRGDFLLIPPGKTTVGPGQSTTFKVTFRPKASGGRSAAIQIKSNDADENPFDIKLGGKGKKSGKAKAAAAFLE